MPTSHLEHLAEVRLASERRLAIIATTLFLVPGVLWVYVDASLAADQNRLLAMEAMRVVQLLLWAGSLFYFRRASHEGMRRMLFFLALVIVAFVTANALLRPPTNWLPLRVMVLISIGTFVVYPYEFRRQLIAWLALLASAAGLMWGYYVTMPTYDRVAAAITLVLAGALGMLVARNREQLDQDLDASLARERDAIAAREQALEELRTLEGVIPICSYCHEVRTEVGAWQRLDHYVRSRTEAQFSHGICPKCATKHFPGLLDHTHSRAGETGATVADPA